MPASPAINYATIENQQIIDQPVNEIHDEYVQSRLEEFHDDPFDCICRYARAQAAMKAPNKALDVNHEDYDPQLLNRLQEAAQDAAMAEIINEGAAGSSFEEFIDSYRRKFAGLDS